MLLTRSPLSPGPKPRFSLDLHVLSAPPAFVLSQDQTLREENMRPYTPAETGRAGQFFSFELELNSSSHSREASAPEGDATERPIEHRVDGFMSSHRPSLREVSTFHAVEFSKTAPLWRQ